MHLGESGLNNNNRILEDLLMVLWIVSGAEHSSRNLTENSGNIHLNSEFSEYKQCK